MDNIVKKAMQATLYLVVVCLFVWALFPKWSLVASGVILGSAASAVNALLLRRKIEYLGHIATGVGKKRLGIGLGSRVSMILLVVMIAYRFPLHFNLIATLVACFFVQYFVWASALVNSIRNTRRKE